MHPLVEIFIQKIMQRDKQAAFRALSEIEKNFETSPFMGMSEIFNDLIGILPGQNYTLLQSLYSLGKGWQDLTERLFNALDVMRPKTNGDTQLHVAAEIGDENLMQRRLAEKKGFINAKNSDGFTPLHRASAYGHAHIVELLLKFGADKEARANSVGAYEQTPLYLAATNNQVSAAEVLLLAGADPNTRVKGGQTALHGAAIHNHPAMIALLIIHGAVIDMRTVDNDGGMTPLHLAAKNSADLAVQKLLELGADTNLQTKVVASRMDKGFIFQRVFWLTAYQLAANEAVTIKSHTENPVPLVAEHAKFQQVRHANVLRALECQSDPQLKRPGAPPPGPR